MKARLNAPCDSNLHDTTPQRWSGVPQTERGVSGWTRSSTQGSSYSILWPMKRCQGGTTAPPAICSWRLTARLPRRRDRGSAAARWIALMQMRPNVWLSWDVSVKGPKVFVSFRDTSVTVSQQSKTHRSTSAPAAKHRLNEVQYIHKSPEWLLVVYYYPDSLSDYSM